MTKKYSQLSLEQRYQIAALRSSGKTLQQISEQLGCNRSTVSRELYRNTPQGGRGQNHYDPKKAEEKTRLRHRKKNKQVRFTNKMKRKTKEWMEQDKLSPEFISAKGKIEYGDFVSHKVLYRWIWQCKFSDRIEHRDYKMLYKELKHGKRRSKRGSFKRTRGQIPNRVSIEERPEIIIKRKRLGDLETDLMLGKNHQAGLLVIVDRATLKTYLTKIVSKHANYIATCMNRKLAYHKNWIKTITFDNDSAFTDHARVSQVIGCKNYFTRPYTSQDKGTVENRIGILRMFFPKQTDFTLVTSETVKKVEKKINKRPIRKFNYKSANEVFDQQKNKLILLH